MAVIFTDGFDAYGVTNGDTPTGIKWPGVTVGGSIKVQDGRFGGKSMEMGNGNATFLTTTTLNIQDITVGFAVNFRQALTDGVFIIVDLRDGTTTGLAVEVQTNGELAVKFMGTIIATTVGLSLSTLVWHTVELVAHIHNSTGSYELWCNGTMVLSGTGIDTQPSTNAYVATARVGRITNLNSAVRYDDCYIKNDLTALNNFKIQTIFPSADDSVNLAKEPNSGTNFSKLTDNPSDDDTTYVYGTAGDADDYEYDDTSGFLAIHAVSVNTRVRVTDASTLTFRTRVNGVDQGSRLVAETSYVNVIEIFAENPATTDPWLPYEVDSATFGVKIE